MKFLAATIISLASIAVAQPYSTPPTDHATTTSDCSTRTSTYPTTTSDCTTSTSSCKSTETPKACPKHCDDGKPEECKCECRPEKRPEHAEHPKCPNGKDCPPQAWECKPGTYECAQNATTGKAGWNVCGVNSKWVYGGDCESGRVCKFNKVNQSPYCVPSDYEFPKM